MAVGGEASAAQTSGGDGAGGGTSLGLVAVVVGVIAVVGLGFAAWLLAGGRDEGGSNEAGESGRAATMGSTPSLADADSDREDSLAELAEDTRGDDTAAGEDGSPPTGIPGAQPPNGAGPDDPVDSSPLPPPTSLPPPVTTATTLPATTTTTVPATTTTTIPPASPPRIVRFGAQSTGGPLCEELEEPQWTITWASVDATSGELIVGEEFYEAAANGSMSVCADVGTSAALTVIGDGGTDSAEIVLE